MIVRYSIPADDPELVGMVIAQIWDGHVHPERFATRPGAHVAIAGDDSGTSIEFYPRPRPDRIPTESRAVQRPGDSTTHHPQRQIATTHTRTAAELLSLAEPSRMTAHETTRA